MLNSSKTKKFKYSSVSSGDIKVGLQYDKLPGEWYGPTTAAQVLRDLVHFQVEGFGASMEMYVPQEGVVYVDVVERLCSPGTSNENQKANDIITQDLPLYDPLLNPPP